MMGEEPIHQMMFDSCSTELHTAEQETFRLRSARLYQRGKIGRVEIRLEGIRFLKGQTRWYWLEICFRISVHS